MAADAVLGLMRSIHFDAQGFSRTYWDFFSAFGFFLRVSFVRGGISVASGGPSGRDFGTRAQRCVGAICFVAVTALSWRYAFTTPIVFSTLITLWLIAAAWLSAIGHSKPLP